MTTITDLQQTLDQWTLRLRWQRALTWSLRGLIAGLVFSLTFGALGLYRAQLVRSEFLWLVFSVSLISPLIFGLIAYFWRIPPLEAARHFDLLFHLEERVSTALELHQHPEHIPPEILDRQLTDAVTASKSVQPSRVFPLSLKLREGLFALLFAALIGLVWFRGEAWFEAAQHAQAVRDAVAEQAAQIEELVQAIQANENLTDEQKDALTQPLNEALQSLQDNPSLENAVSVLTTTGEKLQELSDPQADEMSEALQQTGEGLANQEGSPLESVGDQLAQGNTVNAATELANIDVSELSAEEQAQLAEQLQEMAESLESTNPELASQLNEAAEALQNGDAEAAQQALDQAAQSLAQAGQQIAASEAASQAASQLGQGAGEVLAAGGGQQGGQTAQSGQGSNQGGQNSGDNGSGSGSGSDAGSNPNGSNQAGSDPISQGAVSDGGESGYEQIYAPQLLGGDGGPQVVIPPSGDDSGDVVGVGPTTPGEPGSSTVPYNEVYSQYEQLNNQAIQNSDIPPSFMQIIKNYFDSLKP